MILRLVGELAHLSLEFPTGMTADRWIDRFGILVGKWKGRPSGVRRRLWRAESRAALIVHT